MVSDELDDDRGGFAAAEADRRAAAAQPALLERVQERHHDARARGADRMTQRHRAAAHVHALTRDLELVAVDHRL